MVSPGRLGPQLLSSLCASTPTPTAFSFVSFDFSLSNQPCPETESQHRRGIKEAVATKLCLPLSQAPLISCAWFITQSCTILSRRKHIFFQYFYILYKILQNDWHCKRITSPRSWNSKGFLCVWHFILQVFQSLLLELLYNFLFHSLFSPAVRLTFPLHQNHSFHSLPWGQIQR